MPISKNPNLIVNKIDNDFYFVVNPFVSNGLQIINVNQFVVLDSIDGETDITQLSAKTEFLQEDIITTCKILEKKNIVSFTNVFSKPLWNYNVNSIGLWVHTTNDCCLRCSYCYIHTLGLKDFIPSENIERLCEKLKQTVQQKQLQKVSLRLAGGEPLMKFNLWKPYLLELKETLKTLHCQLNITFLTNLVLLNDEMIHFVKENNFGIAVSLDGLKEYQNNTRYFENGKGSFDIVEKNIHKLLDNDIPFGIMTVVSNENLDGLEQLTKFITERNLKFRFSFVQGENLDIPKLISVLHNCYEILSEAIEKGYQFSKNHSLCDLKFLEPFFQTCGNGFNSGALYTDGNIYFCQKGFGTDTPNGSIFEEDDLLSIVQRKTHYNTVNSDCQQCNLQYICTSGCPLERENEKDPHCEVYKEIIPLIFKLIAKERLFKIKLNNADKKTTDNVSAYCRSCCIPTLYQRE